MRLRTTLTLCALGVAVLATSQTPLKKPLCSDVLAVAKKVNAYFMKKVPDPTAPSFVGQQRPSNIWTRAVYYEGLLDLYSVYPDNSYFDYAYKWGKFHDWSFHGGDVTRNADNYAVAQIYMLLHDLDPEEVNLHHVRALMNMLVNAPTQMDWWWIDAIHMGLPGMTKYGRLTSNRAVYDKAWEIYQGTKYKQGGIGLFDSRHDLWYRDANFLAPYKEPNGKPCFWSRGNGWVMFALTRAIDNLPQPVKDIYNQVIEDFHRQDYSYDIQAMAKALLPLQRVDGFWNASLMCEENHGGMETTGTALFVASLAWGIRNGVLPEKTYLQPMLRGWYALVANSIRNEGSLGYVQGTGAKPADGAPWTATTTPDFEDFGIGCFLLAASEVYKIAEPGKK